MAASASNHFCENSQQFPIERFEHELFRLSRVAGLYEASADKILGWFLQANKEETPLAKQEKFKEVFIPYVEKKGSPVLERSCFHQNSFSKQQEQIDLIHYRCLRTFDRIFDLRSDPFYQWVDSLYDQKQLTAGQALLILLLVTKSVRSLMKIQSEDTKGLTELIQNAPKSKIVAQFSRGLVQLKREFPLKDEEFALFTEVVHAIFRMRKVDGRALFQNFLNYYLSSLKQYNAQLKECLCDRLQAVYLSARQEARTGIPSEKENITYLVRAVPKIKLEANRYQLLKIYDQTVGCRTAFAQEIDRLVDEKRIPLKMANELLALADLPMSWTYHSFAQHLLRVEGPYRIILDKDALWRAFEPQKDVAKEKMPRTPVR